MIHNFSLFPFLYPTEYTTTTIASQSIYLYVLQNADVDVLAKQVKLPKYNEWKFRVYCNQFTSSFFQCHYYCSIYGMIKHYLMGFLHHFNKLTYFSTTSHHLIMLRNLLGNSTINVIACVGIFSGCHQIRLRLHEAVHLFEIIKLKSVVRPTHSLFSYWE